MSTPVFNAKRARSIGIDVGGTNIRAARFEGLAAAANNFSPGDAPPIALKPAAEKREKVGDERGPETIVSRLANIVQELEAGTAGELIPVGIGFAGMLRGQQGMVAKSPHLFWHDVDFGGMIREALGDNYDIVIDNDVNAITFGEWAVGAGAGASDVLAVFVGTGIGGGMITGGKLVSGRTNCAGEIGHFKVVFDDTARKCACGLTGCVEAYAGGEALQRRARAELAGRVRSMAIELAGGAANVNPGHLDEAAANGDDYALDLFADIAPLLGATLANAVTLLNPSRLVLGGGMLSRTPVLREHVLAAFEAAVNPPALEELRIVDTALGDDAGIVGSALLALSER